MLESQTGRTLQTVGGQECFGGEKAKSELCLKKINIAAVVGL